LEVKQDVTDRNEEVLAGYRKTEGNRFVEIGWRMPRVEVAGDICLRRSRPIEGSRSDDDDDDDGDYNINNNNNNNNQKMT
jgi:hypothetical protein